MSSGAQVVEIRGDAAVLVREAQKAERALAKTREEVKRLGGENRKLAATANESAAGAAKQAEVNKKLATGLDELRQRNEKLDSELRRVNRDYEKMISEQMKLYRTTDLLARENEKLAGSMGRVGREATGAGGAGAAGLGRMLTSVKSLVGGLIGAGGLLGALAMVSNEYNNLREREGAAADLQMNVSNARQAVVANMSTKGEGEIAAALKAGEEAAAASGVSETVTQQAMAFGLSASNANLEATRDVVMVASKAFSYTPEDIPLMVGSLLDLAKVTGSNDAMTNLGYLTQVGEQSRIAEPLLQARNVPKALIALTNAGLTAEESSALFGTITEGTGDFSGESSGTAATQLVKQVRDFVKDKKQFDGMGFSDTLRAIQSHPKLSEELLKDASFEAKFDAPLRNFLSSGAGGISKGYEDRLNSFSQGVDYTGVAENFMAAKSVNPLYASAQSARENNQFTERLQTANPEAAAEVELRGMMEQLKATGALAMNMVPGVNPYEIRFRTMVSRGEDPKAARAAILDDHAKSLNGPEVPFSKVITGGPVGAMAYGFDQMFSETKEQAAAWRPALEGEAERLRGESAGVMKEAAGMMLEAAKTMAGGAEKSRSGDNLFNVLAAQIPEGRVGGAEMAARIPIAGASY